MPAASPDNACAGRVRRRRSGRYPHVSTRAKLKISDPLRGFKPCLAWLSRGFRMLWDLRMFDVFRGSPIHWVQRDFQATRSAFHLSPSVVLRLLPLPSLMIWRPASNRFF